MDIENDRWARHPGLLGERSFINFARRPCRSISHLVVQSSSSTGRRLCCWSQCSGSRLSFYGEKKEGRKGKITEKEKKRVIKININRTDNRIEQNKIK